MDTLKALNTRATHQFTMQAHGRGVSDAPGTGGAATTPTPAIPGVPGASPTVLDPSTPSLYTPVSLSAPVATGVSLDKDLVKAAGQRLRQANAETEAERERADALEAEAASLRSELAVTKRELTQGLRRLETENASKTTSLERLLFYKCRELERVRHLAAAVLQRRTDLETVASRAIAHITERERDRTAQAQHTQRLSPVLRQGALPRLPTTPGNRLQTTSTTRRDARHRANWTDDMATQSRDGVRQTGTREGAARARTSGRATVMGIRTETGGASSSMSRANSALGALSSSRSRDMPSLSSRQGERERERSGLSTQPVRGGRESRAGRERDTSDPVAKSDRPIHVHPSASIAALSDTAVDNVVRALVQVMRQGRGKAIPSDAPLPSGTIPLTVSGTGGGGGVGVVEDEDGRLDMMD
ncbi:hypothetical protein KIPB_001211 [Kipferlia bialata]|uniref:Uncharacterized protein n=2 Tax=Kipferlia bialata TaxID=797122 RepID=A0A9K3GDZ8_9EUKA|nr:hypothetical protein KIPB_001211 [Kipferlia bialata]|eukprot:g1211.t1